MGAIFVGYLRGRVSLGVSSRGVFEGVGFVFGGVYGLSRKAYREA